MLQVNGDNPAIIHVGATYNDLGAQITGPQADLNLGIKTFLNGALVSNIVLDTTEAATDTIQYVATDQNGLAATTTRTVIVERAAAPSIVPTDDASTSQPTSTNQWYRFHYWILASRFFAANTRVPTSEQYIKICPAHALVTALGSVGTKRGDALFPYMQEDGRPPFKTNMMFGTPPMFVARFAGESARYFRQTMTYRSPCPIS